MSFLLFFYKINVLLAHKISIISLQYNNEYALKCRTLPTCYPACMNACLGQTTFWHFTQFAQDIVEPEYIHLV